ncbi:MAG TPA: hypothetical protein EYQ41_03090 [Micavibrio sp.]|nr:hypothetical protein [Micavibrio sp.]
MREAKIFPPAEDDTYPALKFQRLFQMEDRNIGRSWRMPNGMSMVAVEQAMWKSGLLELWDDCLLETRLTSDLAEQKPRIAERFALAENLADTFILLNPELRDVSFDRAHWYELRGFLHGVVSGFNPDDLQAWIDKTINYPLIDELQDYIRQEFYAPESQSTYPPSLRRYFNEKVAAGHPYVDYELHAVLWAPSEKTVYRIYDELEARRAFMDLPALKPK